MIEFVDTQPLRGEILDEPIESDRILVRNRSRFGVFGVPVLAWGYS